MMYLSPEEQAAARRARVIALTRHAQFKGLNVTTAQVSRHFKNFNRWYVNAISTGQLLRLTGVKYRGQDGE